MNSNNNQFLEQVDVLIVTAIKLEYDALLKVDTGAAPSSKWEHREGPTGFNVAFRSFRAADGGMLRVAATYALTMGGVAAAGAAAPLVNAYQPRCLAMCGVCAGRKGHVCLGDVIIGDRLWSYDTGATVVEKDHDGQEVHRFKADQYQYQLDPIWTQRAESFMPEGQELWLKDRPYSYEEQRDWLMEFLLAGNSPKNNAYAEERRRRCADYAKVVTQLRELGFLKKTGPISLSSKGRKYIKEKVEIHLDGLPERKDFAIHVGPIGSGTTVQRDPHIFDKLSEQMRKVIGLEMEASAIGVIAHTLRKEMIVMKGVMDYADQDKNDNFKKFAARASSECLIAFLRENLSSAEGATKKTEEGLAERAAEHRWEYVKTHPITGIEVLFLLKTPVGYDWFRELLNDTRLSFSRKKRSFKLGQLLQQTSTAPNTTERTRDSDEPVCAFWDVYEPEAGFWVKRIAPNPSQRTVVIGFDATIPWYMLGVDGVVNLQDLGLLTEIGISIPARAYQVGVEEFTLAFYGETFSYAVNLSDHSLEALHEFASVQHTVTKSDKPMPLGTSFSGVQLLEMFLLQMLPSRETTKGKRERFMMGMSGPNGRAVSFYPTMPLSFTKSAESKQYTFSITTPGKIDSKIKIAKVHEQLQTDPSNLEHHVRLAALYSYEGRLTDVVKCLQVALDRGITSVEIHCLMAEALGGFGRHQDALSHAEKAVTLAPESASSESMLGICLANLDRNEEALSHFEAAVRLLPLKARHHANLARAYSLVQKYDQAIGSYQEALRLDDNDARSHMMLGLLLDEYGDGSMTKEHLEAAVRIEPKSHEALISLGRYHALRDEHSVAIGYFQRAVNIEPDPHYYELLGGSYADRDRWFEAENAFRKAAELNPTNGSLVRNLGACLANQGKLDDAFKKFEEACRIDPTDAVAQQATEQLRAHLERNKRAEDMQSEKGN